MKPKYEQLKPLFKRAMTLKTQEEIDGFLKEARYMAFQHQFFTEVVESQIWNTPSKFLEYIVEHHSATMSTRSTCGALLYKVQQDAIAARLSTGVAIEAMREAPATADIVAAVATADLEEAPRSTRGRGSRPVARDDDEEDEDASDWVDDDDAEPVSRRGRSSSSSSREIIDFRVFGDETKGTTDGRTIAKILHTDPFKFMTDLQFKLPAGVKLKKPAVGATAPTLSVEVTNGESAFELIKLLNGRQGLPDQV